MPVAATPGTARAAQGSLLAFTWLTSEYPQAPVGDHSTMADQSRRLPVGISIGTLLR